MKLIVVTDIFSRPSASECLSTKLPGMTSIMKFALSDLCGKSDLSGEVLRCFLFDQSGIVLASQALLKQIQPGTVDAGYSALPAKLRVINPTGVKFKNTQGAPIK